MFGTLWIEPGSAMNPTLPLSRSEVEPYLKRLMDVLGLGGAEVEIRFLDDAAIERLNREFLGLPGPTNVLSFPAEDPARPDYLGEIALSVDTLCREAALYGQEPADHLARLLAHGLLHLAGYEHGLHMDELTDMAVEQLSLPLPS